jgi:cell shape-determining protein MreC
MDKGSRLTAFFAVLIAIISMGWSLYFHHLFNEERKLKEQAIVDLGEARAELGLIKQKNAELARDLRLAKELEQQLVEEKKVAERSLEEANQRIVTLAADLEKTASDVEAASKVPERLTEVTADKKEIEEELEKVRNEKAKLEIELQKRTGTIPGAVDVGEVRVQTGKRFAGKVLVVNRRYDFVVIDLGKDHGMETGVVLILHRGRQFLGKVQVEKVYERMSAATLMADWMQDNPEVGDGVKKF